MRSGGTISVLFTDIVGSTDLLSRLGDARWDEVRRAHFTAIRDVLTEHSGTEVKNTGDGVMATFASALDAINCSIAMHSRVKRDAAVGSPVAIRIGLATGEATSEHGDWFGSPVIEAARLCALAAPGTTWATSIVRALAGSSSSAVFDDIGAQVLKGFDRPVDIVAVQPGPTTESSYYAVVDKHEEVSDRLVGQLDFWESLPSLQQMRSTMLTALAPIAGDRVCDIGFGAGTELIRLARIVGPQGRAVGVEASQLMCDEAQRRAADAGVEIEVIQADGRQTGFPDGHFDGLRIERVIQHVGDVAGFLREAMRVVRPGGRIVFADSDWGSLMIHPGDRTLINRFKNAFETGYLADPWAGRTLHGAMLDAGLVDVDSRVHPVSAGSGVMDSMKAFLARRVSLGVGSQAELETLNVDLEAAMERGDGVYAFCMFVAWGRRP
ncbi:MAG: methyltransferase domain-containing protein [Actinomycetia bacterium]|nr:methyltransferase domain-containing protein [Actinomycetes bacterium]